MFYLMLDLYVPSILGIFCFFIVQCISYVALWWSMLLKSMSPIFLSLKKSRLEKVLLIRMEGSIQLQAAAVKVSWWGQLYVCQTPQTFRLGMKKAANQIIKKKSG